MAPSTLCYRKSAVINVGNYDKNKSRMTEDFEIALKLLKRYKYIYNFTIDWDFMRNFIIDWEFWKVITK